MPVHTRWLTSCDLDSGMILLIVFACLSNKLAGKTMRTSKLEVLLGNMLEFIQGDKTTISPSNVGLHHL